MGRRRKIGKYDGPDGAGQQTSDWPVPELHGVPGSRARHGGAGVSDRLAVNIDRRDGTAGCRPRLAEQPRPASHVDGHAVGE